VTFPGHEFFEQVRADWENRFSAHKSEVATILDKHHNENKSTLQALSVQSISNGVKLDKLYGSEGQPGAVDKLSDKVQSLGDKIVYASGFLAAVVILVGWYITLHK
jgi:hypothetical protein